MAKEQKDACRDSTCLMPVLWVETRLVPVIGPCTMTS